MVSTLTRLLHARKRRGFILGYRVHIACCADSELPLAFAVAPCNENDKVYFEPLLEKVNRLGVGFRSVLADTCAHYEEIYFVICYAFISKRVRLAKQMEAR